MPLGCNTLYSVCSLLLLLLFPILLFPRKKTFERLLRNGMCESVRVPSVSLGESNLQKELNGIRPGGNARESNKLLAIAFSII